MITSLREEDAGCYAGYLLVCLHFIVLRFTTFPVGAGGGLLSLKFNVTLHGDLFIFYFHFQNKQLSDLRKITSFSSIKMKITYSRLQEVLQIEMIP